jgi:hypothetical protein
LSSVPETKGQTLEEIETGVLGRME